MIALRSVLCMALLVSLSMFAVQPSAAASIGFLQFYSDAQCTVPVNASAVANVSTSYTQWSALPVVDVFDSESPACINQALAGGVQSGKYECLSGFSGVGGLVVVEYTAANCSGAPVSIFEFLGAPNATCILGQIELPALGAPPTPLYAAVTCLNQSTPSNAASGDGAVDIGAVLLATLSAVALLSA